MLCGDAITLYLKGIHWLVSSCSETAQNPAPISKPQYISPWFETGVCERACVRVVLCTYYWLLGTRDIAWYSHWSRTDLTVGFFHTCDARKWMECHQLSFSSLYTTSCSTLANSLANQIQQTRPECEQHLSYIWQESEKTLYILLYIRSNGRITVILACTK